MSVTPETYQEAKEAMAYLKATGPKLWASLKDASDENTYTFTARGKVYTCGALIVTAMKGGWKKRQPDSPSEGATGPRPVQNQSALETLLNKLAILCEHESTNVGWEDDDDHVMIETHHIQALIKEFESSPDRATGNASANQDQGPGATGPRPVPEVDLFTRMGISAAIAHWLITEGISPADKSLAEELFNVLLKHDSSSLIPPPSSP